LFEHAQLRLFLSSFPSLSVFSFLSFFLSFPFFFFFFFYFSYYCSDFFFFFL